MINNTRSISRVANANQPQSKATSNILNKWQQTSGDFGMQGMLRRSIEAKVNKQTPNPVGTINNTIGQLASTNTGTMTNAGTMTNTVEQLDATNTGAMANTINPGIKPSGAPVSFSPRAQSAITSAFGNPIANSYDRTVSGPTPIPEPIISSNVPPSNF